MVLFWYGHGWLLCVVFCSLLIFSLLWGEVWQRINEYENMKSRGYTLMQDDKGDDFWVGYGD